MDSKIRQMTGELVASCQLAQYETELQRKDDLLQAKDNLIFQLRVENQALRHEVERLKPMEAWNEKLMVVDYHLLALKQLCDKILTHPEMEVTPQEEGVLEKIRQIRNVAAHPDPTYIEIKEGFETVIDTIRKAGKIEDSEANILLKFIKRWKTSCLATKAKSFVARDAATWGGGQKVAKGMALPGVTS